MPIIKPLSFVLLVALIMSNAGWPNDAVALASRGPEAANRGTQLVDEEEDDEPPPAEPYFGQDRTTGKFIPSTMISDSYVDLYRQHIAKNVQNCLGYND